MHPRIHVDHALDRLTADEAELRRARTARQVADELAMAEGSASRDALRGAARRTRQGAVAVGAAGVLLAPQATGVAAAADAPPAPPVAGQPDAGQPDAGQPDAAAEVAPGASGDAAVAAAEAVAGAAGDLIEDVVDVAQQAVDAAEQAPSDAADDASAGEADVAQPTSEAEQAEAAPEGVEEAAEAADAVEQAEDAQDAVDGAVGDAVGQLPDVAAPATPTDVVGEAADALPEDAPLPEDALPDGALPEDTVPEAVPEDAPAGPGLPDQAADAAHEAVEDVAVVAEDAVEDAVDAVDAAPPVVEDVAPIPATPPAAPQAPARPNRPSTPPRPQPQPQPLPAPHVPGPPVSLPEVAAPDLPSTPPQPVRVDPVASPQPDRLTAPVVEAVYAVDPVISPNLRLTPRPVVAPPAAPTLEERLHEAQSRPVDEARVSAWTAAVAQAWTAMQQGSGTPDAVVAADDVAATPTLGWSYAVQPGDTLWTISERVWGTSELSASDLADTWQLIYTWNADQLGADPDMIPVGAVIQIPADIGSTA